MSIIAEIDAQIAELQSKKETIQDQCNHPPAAVVSQYSGDIEDEYGSFIERGGFSNLCTLCGKRFSTKENHV